jgi:hypothetical protein
MGVGSVPLRPVQHSSHCHSTGQPLNVAGRMHPHEEREWQTRKTRIDGRLQGQGWEVRKLA